MSERRYTANNQDSRAASGAVSDPAAGANIVDLQPHEFAASELAVDGD